MIRLSVQWNTGRVVSVPFISPNALWKAFHNAFGQQKAEKHAWLVLQENMLFKDDVQAVIKELSWLAKRYPRQAGELKKEVNYFIIHTSIMQYGSFRKQHLLIGSEPIESANRQVIQQRLKLSGQRCTKLGL
ncbi:MAG TPA: hypothetical protein VNE41_07710 [Chitinophagaceae bacterium]|nr:hypothetical protein [Chitinophagaceae bacterium]